MNDSIYSDTSHSLRIDAGRFELSPYHAFYANAETLLGVAAGRFYPAFNGEDSEAVYWSLRRAAVLFDVPEKPWQIEGPDALRFLQQLFARRIDDLPLGRGRYAIACTPDGGTFMDGILFKLAPDRYWYVQPDGALQEWLLAHRQGFDISVSDPRVHVLQLQGPNSLQIMNAASAGAIDDRMKYFDSGFFELGGQRVYVSRTGWTGELGYEIYARAGQTDHRKLWDHLFACGAPQDLVFGSLAAMGLRRIEAGILDNLSDFDASMTPFEAGLGAFIDLDKPAFIGRQALLTAARQTLIHGLKCPSSAPRGGAEILHDGVRVGRVTTGGWSPFLDIGIGYVRFDRAGDWCGKPVSMRTPAGEVSPCEIVSLPFYDAAKKIPRGLAPALPRD